MAKEISPKRKGLYYTGMALAAAGIGVFFFTFISTALRITEGENHSALPYGLSISGSLSPTGQAHLRKQLGIPSPSHSAFDGSSHDSFNRMSNRMALSIVFVPVAIVGMLLMSVAKQGAAGSGLILDPPKAREDLEPWARMGGGMVKDALDEAGISLSAKVPDPETSVTPLPFDEQLRRLKRLRDDGVLDEAEYQTQKQRVLEKM